jgi:hypothetical protein
VSVLSYVPPGADSIGLDRLARFALLAGAASLIAGCGRHTEPPKSSVPEAASAEAADPIPPFVDYLRRNGIGLEKDPELSGWWKVVEPPSEGPFDVGVSLMGFPPDRTASEMEQDLLQINLAHRLNAPARLAMSYPGLRGRPGVALGHVPDPDSLPISKELVRLFRLYRGPEAVGAAGR